MGKKRSLFQPQGHKKEGKETWKVQMQHSQLKVQTTAGSGQLHLFIISIAAEM
jgi:hypothetical protein